MEGGVRICIISPPALDESTAALFVSWIKGEPPARLQAIAREYYDNGARASNTNYVAIALEMERELELERERERERETNKLEPDEDHDTTATTDDLADWEVGGGVGGGGGGGGLDRDSSGGQGEGGGGCGGGGGGAGADGAGAAGGAGHGASAAAEEKVGADDTSKRHQLVFRRKRNFYVEATTELIKSAVNDDIRTFEALEHYLCSPQLLRSQTMIQIYSLKMQAFVIEKYWSLDDVVVREVVVGSKRLTRSRKDLDDVSESTGISLRSVTRQFDNLKRLYTAVEDNDKCNLFDFVQRNVLLTPELSRKYACILFLLYSKFTLTSKKRMTRVNLPGLEKCAALTLACLVSDCNTFFRLSKEVEGDGSTGAAAQGSQRSHSASISSSSSSPTPANVAPPVYIVDADSGSNRASHSNSLSIAGAASAGGGAADGPALSSSPQGGGNSLDLSDGAMCERISTGDVTYCWNVVWSVFSHVEAVDPDKQLMNSLRDIKNALTGDTLNSGCQNVTNALVERGGGTIAKKMEGSRLRTILKAIMQIGANLSQTREYRDFFEDILTKVAEPLEEAGLSLSDMNTFLICCAGVIRAIPETHRVSSLSAPTKFDKIDRKKDWSRFLLCVRLLVIQLVQGSP